MAETTPTFIQLKNAAGTPIFPKVDLRNVQGELAMDKVTGLSDAITEAVANAGHITKQIVERSAEQSIADALTAVANKSDKCIYLVPLQEGDEEYDAESPDTHLEYMWIAETSEFQPIGSTKTNLDDYYTKSEVYTQTEADALLDDKANASDVYTKAEVGTLAAGEAVIENNKLNAAYAPELKFQGQSVGNLFNSLNIIGIGNVSVDADGNVTLRLGENLNCSLWNGTDGISKATVAGSNANITSGTYTVSGDYSAVSDCGSKTVIRDKSTSSLATYTATPGTTATSATGAMSNNGNEVHFDDNATGYFIVEILEGVNTVSTKYIAGPINASKTYNGKPATIQNGELVSVGAENAGVTCTIASFDKEPMSAKGATGYSGTVSISVKPATLYGKSTDFEIESISQVTVGADGVIKNVATWTADSKINGAYFYLKEATTPATPATASYACDSVTTKVVSGVTYITTASKFHAEATGLANIGYPASTTNKAKVAYNNDTWTDGITDTAESAFTTWTTAKDATMSYRSGQFSPKIGEHNAPKVAINGINAIGSGSTKVSAAGVKLLVCDADGHISASYGEFAAKESWTDGEFMIYDGCLVYPSKDFTGYNALGVSGAPTTQPNYSSDGANKPTKACVYEKTFNVSADLPSCTVTLGHKASISSALSAGTLKVEIFTAAGVFKDIGNSSIGKVSAGTTSTSIAVTFDPADILKKDTTTKVRITMSSAVAEIKSIAFA